MQGNKLAHLFKLTVNSVPSTYVVRVAFSMSIVSDRWDTMVCKDESFFQSDFNNSLLTLYVLDVTVPESLLVVWVNAGDI